MAINNNIYAHTYSGRLIDIAHFQKSDIDLRDISVSLSRQRRYGGHTAVPWTVAQHLTLCGVMADMMGCSDDDIKAVFLHDIEETWVQDVIFPIKRNLMLGRYDKICREISDVVYDFFGLKDFFKSSDNKHMVECFDRAAYILEAFTMVPGFVHDQNMFHDDVNSLVTTLVDKGFHIPQNLIDVDELEMAQDMFEILNVWAAEKTLGAPISSELPQGITIEGNFKVIEKGPEDVE